MAFDFPTSPTNGQTFVAGAVTYVWNGYGWEMLPDDKVPVTQVGDSPPASPKHGQLWWESDQGVLWIYYNDGTSAQWVEADKGGMNGASKTYVDVAAMNAMSYSGIQINGGMDVSQEKGAAVTTGSVTYAYIVDGWRLQSSGTQVITGAQVVNVPPLNNMLRITATTGNAAPLSSEWAALVQPIEGYRCVRLAFGTSQAKPVTFAFWVFMTRVGTFSGTVRNSGATRSCAFTFTMTAANTWEYKVVTIPGDTGGVWLANNGLGLELVFNLMGHSSYMIPPGVWTAGNFEGATGSTNILANAGDKFDITGVIVLPGIYAPTAAQSPLIMRPYGEELVLCQRYYEKRTGRPIIYGGNINTGQAYNCASTFHTTKRAIPTMTYTHVGSVYFAASGPPTAQNVTVDGVSVENVATATSTYGYYIYDYVADARL